MDYLKPTFLYLLILIPLLLLLYMLKLRRKTYIVSSSLLWEQAIEDMKANVPFQRFRKNLLLPLQIFFLLLVIFALARPFLQGAVSVAQNTVLIIDNSASMKATDIGESRFETAKSAASQMINKLGDDAKMMLISAASSPKIISNFTANKLALQNALNGIYPTDLPADYSRAIQLAASLIRDMGNSEILIMGDGAREITLQNAISDARSNISVRFMQFGKAAIDNIGITAFEAMESPINSSEKQVFLTLRNFGNTDKEPILLEIYHNENLLAVRELILPANDMRSFIFDELNYNTGIISARLDVDDDLDVDNHANYVLTDQDLINVLLVSEDCQRLEAATRTALAGIQLSKESPGKYSGEKSHDAIIFNKFVPDVLPDADVIFVNPDKDLPFGKLDSFSDNPTIIDWERNHPVMRFVDLSNLLISGANNYKMLPMMDPLVESDAGVPIWVGEYENRRIIVLAFDIQLNSSNNFSMLTAFPIFMSNALGWLARIDDNASHRQLSPGETLRLSLPENKMEQTVKLREPDGRETEIYPQDNEIAFADTGMVGIYEIKGIGFSAKFAVNLLNESESNIKAADKIEFSGQEIAGAKAAIMSNKEIWGILIFMALILLGIEWWIYHRRILI